MNVRISMNVRVGLPERVLLICLINKLRKTDKDLLDDLCFGEMFSTQK